jgi:hypothetical protein
MKMSNAPKKYIRMSSTLKRYIKMMAKRNHIRYVNNGEDSQGEDDILDEMDDLWYKLNGEEDRIRKGE